MTPEQRIDAFLQRIDAALDSVLKASGSALRHYTMPKTLADMREAMRKAMEAEAQAKEAAHRQGPWHVSEHTDGRDALIYDEDGFEVARVCYPNRDADAKLIAAAPGLLAAIEAMRVAGGAAEFQAAFDKAKKLAMVHN